MGTLHAGNIETSHRLQHTLHVLQFYGSRWASTLDIARRTQSCAVHSDMAALKANGIQYEQRYRPGSRRVSEYRLKG